MLINVMLIKRKTCRSVSALELVGPFYSSW